MGNLLWPFIASIIFSVTCSQDVSLSFHNGDYTLQWALDEGQVNITFEVRVKNSGWLGFGVSHSGTMEDADIALAEVNADAEIPFLDLKDYHSQTPGFPILDATNDIQILESRRTDGESYIKFTRALDTGDAEHDIAIPLTGIYIMWAYSPETPYMMYHAREFRGQQFVVFDAEATTPPPTTRPTTSATTAATEGTTEPGDNAAISLSITNTALILSSMFSLNYFLH